MTTNTERTHVMLDLETLGGGYLPAILSIGAVQFTPGSTTCLDPFYAAINVVDSQKWGFNVDAETLRWWMKQSSEAQKVFHDDDAMEIADALFMFEQWYPEGALLWGKPSTFDNRILREAYEHMGPDIPWSHKDDRDMRTYMKMFAPIEKPTREGVAHNALDDAIYQVQCMAAVDKETLK